MPDLVIAIDWSSAQGRSPRPRADRCWLAWATSDGYRSQPEYLPTRMEAEERILELATSLHSGARSLIGFDFAFGYPLLESGETVLPAGRELCSLLDSMVTDDAKGRNNRFEVAGELNRQIANKAARSSGPFWGRPGTRDISDLTVTRPTDTGVQRLRTIEREFLSSSFRGSQPKSVWQLFGAGSVGGQSLIGLKYIHRLLSALGSRAHLWPFEQPVNRSDAVTIAEIYPSMFPEALPDVHAIKDARQVLGTCEALMTHPETDRWIESTRQDSEGWILGVPM